MLYSWTDGWEIVGYAREEKEREGKLWDLYKASAGRANLARIKFMMGPQLKTVYRVKVYA